MLEFFSLHWSLLYCEQHSRGPLYFLSRLRLFLLLLGLNRPRGEGGGGVGEWGMMDWLGQRKEKGGGEERAAGERGGGGGRVARLGFDSAGGRVLRARTRGGHRDATWQPCRSFHLAPLERKEGRHTYSSIIILSIRTHDGKISTFPFAKVRLAAIVWNPFYR